jgi:hypothetical protein
VLCVVRWRFLRQANHSSRNPTECGASLCVGYRTLKNEDTLARVGPQRHRKEIYKYVGMCMYVHVCVLYIYDRLRESKTFKVNVENKIQVAVSSSRESVK